MYEMAFKVMSRYVADTKHNYVYGGCSIKGHFLERT